MPEAAWLALDCLALRTALILLGRAFWDFVWLDVLRTFGFVRFELSLRLLLLWDHDLCIRILIAKAIALRGSSSFLQRSSGKTFSSQKHVLQGK